VRRGRGVSANPTQRFAPIVLEPDLEEEQAAWERDAAEAGASPAAGAAAPPPLRTIYLEDHARSAISWNDSPDVGFEASLNPYRGCEHGCAYCYARPYHEYLGFGAGLDFETRILVKRDLPALLEKELLAPRWRPIPLAMCGVTDAYQPVERRLKLTRACLEVLARVRNPVGIVTKNALVARDVDPLADLARDRAAAVWISLTTLDRDLQARLEPRASTPTARLEAMRTLAQAGVPVGVMTAPVIPGLNDHELPALLAAAAEAGARTAGYVMLRLPLGVKDLFVRWLEQHAPLKKEKVLSRLEDLRGGALTDARFGTRMTGEGPFAEQVKALFLAGCRRAGLATHSEPLSTAAFRRPLRGQLELFGGAAGA
jgi:DNA repair photolyase